MEVSTPGVHIGSEPVIAKRMVEIHGTLCISFKKKWFWTNQIITCDLPRGLGNQSNSSGSFKNGHVHFGLDGGPFWTGYFSAGLVRRPLTTPGEFLNKKK